MERESEREREREEGERKGRIKNFFTFLFELISRSFSKKR